MPDSELQHETDSTEQNNQPAEDSAADAQTLDINEYRLDELPEVPGYLVATGGEVAAVPFASAGVGELVAAADLDLTGALRESVQLAEAALAEVAEPELIGELIGAVDEGDGVYSLCFVSRRDGYRDWRWNATLCKVVDEDASAAAPTVLECELVPGPDSLVAPKWIPWAERLAEFSATHDSHGNPIEGEEGEGEPAPARTRTSSRTRTRRRMRRDRSRSNGGAENASEKAEPQKPNDDGKDSDGELPVADDIREFAEERDQQLHGINFEHNDD